MSRSRPGRIDRRAAPHRRLFQCDMEFPCGVANRIVNEVRGINRVGYHLHPRHDRAGVIEILAADSAGFGQIDGAPAPATGSRRRNPPRTVDARPSSSWVNSRLRRKVQQGDYGCRPLDLEHIAGEIADLGTKPARRPAQLDSPGHRTPAAARAFAGAGTAARLDRRSAQPSEADRRWSQCVPAARPAPPASPPVPARASRRAEEAIAVRRNRCGVRTPGPVSVYARPDTRRVLAGV
jgi:hypothetical protein